MLETAPKLEQELVELLCNYVAPPILAIDTHRVFEGHRIAMIRGTGEEDDTDISQISGDAEIEVETILYGTLQEILETFLPTAKSMATSMEQAFIRMLCETTEKTGNKVDGKGQPLSFGLILEMHENLEIAFDHEGNPEMPTMMIHPDMRTRLETLDNDPGKHEFEEELQKMLNRKRLEWHEREANRTLVG